MIGAMYFAVAVRAVHANDKSGALWVSISEVQKVADMCAPATRALGSMALLT